MKSKRESKTESKAGTRKWRRTGGKGTMIVHLFSLINPQFAVVYRWICV
jgi:hypothetical protein